MRVVFDTNVLVAAFAADGLCAKLVRRANQRDFTLLLCPVIVEELRAILKKKLSATEEEIQNVVALIQDVGILAKKIPAPAKTPRIVNDPSDDLILFCAVMNQADFLVTGDRHLLAIQKQGKTKIIDPRGFELLFG